ncbi:hypothetical protein GIB67_037573, partial [Kingdonia uniflora]
STQTSTHGVTYKCLTSSQQSLITKPHHNPPNHVHKSPARMYKNSPGMSIPKIPTSQVTYNFINHLAQPRTSLSHAVSLPPR